jgi:hypothetical protein
VRNVASGITLLELIDANSTNIGLVPFLLMMPVCYYLIINHITIYFTATLTST